MGFHSAGGSTDLRTLMVQKVESQVYSLEVGLVETTFFDMVLHIKPRWCKMFIHQQQGYNPAVQISKAARLVVATPVDRNRHFPSDGFAGDLRIWTKVDLQTGAATQRMYDTFESAKLQLQWRLKWFPRSFFDQLYPSPGSDMILFLCIHSNSVLCVLSLFPQVKDKHRRHQGHSGISGRKYMFVWFAWYRLIFAKGMNNRNTFVFVCVFQGLRLMSPLMGVFLNVL